MAVETCVGCDHNKEGKCTLKPLEQANNRSCMFMACEIGSEFNCELNPMFCKADECPARFDKE